MVETVIGHTAVDRCQRFATSLARAYVGKNITRATVDRRLVGADDMFGLYYAGIAAEYAACLWCGVDPVKALKWNARRSDSGVDFTLPDGQTVDVKASNSAAATRLIWPVTKSLHDIKADLFIFARVLTSKRSAMGQVVDLIGWVGRDTFALKSEQSTGSGGLVRGTRFMQQKNLMPMEIIKGKDVIHE